MIDTSRTTDWPPDMRQAAGRPGAGGFESMAQDAWDALRHYIREQPEAAALCALGIGFVLGWKLKLW